MGSGETAPTMRGVHADLLARVADLPGPAVMLDTPYGFQENADELNHKISDYFARNVGVDIALATWRRTAGASLDVERALERIRSARYLFAGPGSPTYALHQWRDSGLRDAVNDLLQQGGCVTFASAAAVTLGALALPVYEIYKAGIAPEWREGLDILGATGFRAAVIPHFDNREGGTHDTRYCYLGERRLRVLEDDLPPGVFVWGVDEHTACVLDLDARNFQVVGRGGVTVRVAGNMTVFESGRQVAFGEVEEIVSGTARLATTAPMPAFPSAAETPSDDDGYPLLEIAERLDVEQRLAVENRDPEGAVGSVLLLEAALRDWSADTLVGAGFDKARALLRGMIVRLGNLAKRGIADPREQVAPFVEAVLRARRHARNDGAYALADQLREALSVQGVEIRDTPDGVEWLLQSGQRPDSGTTSG